MFSKADGRVVVGCRRNRPRPVAPPALGDVGLMRFEDKQILKVLRTKTEGKENKR